MHRELSTAPSATFSKTMLLFITQPWNPDPMTCPSVHYNSTDARERMAWQPLNTIVKPIELNAC